MCDARQSGRRSINLSVRQSFTHRCSLVRPWIVTAAAPALCRSSTTLAAFILLSDSPDLILTVTGSGEATTMPCTSLASLVGLRRSSAPSPRLVASSASAAR